MRTRRFSFAAVAAAAFVFLTPTSFQVEACGPFFEPDVFARSSLPDNLSAFAHGNLGLLQPRFDSDEFAVAFRYLNGGKLSETERKIYAPAPATAEPNQDWTNLTPREISAAREQMRQTTMNSEPPGQWLKVRAEYAPQFSPEIQNTQFPTDYAGTITFDPNYLNCPNPAFANAVLTLKNRAGAWGAKSPWLLDWIHAQDAVFSNCAGKAAVVPAAAESNSPALLRADRAYQLASAAFYAKQYDDAARQFAAIASDNSSPWHPWGAYLAARATVRKAFAMGPATDPYSGDQATYDTKTMQKAQQMLETLLKQKNPAPSRTIILDELNFIHIRTEPEKRAVEISEALSGPAPDPNFYHDLRDLSWILEREIKVENPPALMAWIADWRGSGTSASAYGTWQQTHALPWLVMALFKASPSDPLAPQLINDAAKISTSSPAYPTVFFHRARLLIGLKRGDEARALLDAELSPSRTHPPDSYRNALLGERMQVARDFSEFLTYAPRSLLATGSEGAEDLQAQCNARAKAHDANAPCPDLKGMQFDNDAVTVLNHLTPISMLIDAANSSTLPQILRTEIALEAWTRSVLLQDSGSAAKLAPLLPEEIRDTAGNGVGFPADLAILRNPGIRPYIEPGVARILSFSTFDDLRDNWWCKPWLEQSDEEDPSKPVPLIVPAFVNASQQSLADAEYAHLQQLPGSVTVIGQRVLDYAKDHTDDPLVPEALALTVRAGHYACSTGPVSPDGRGSEYTAVSKAAFELLHRRYPRSPWALRTKYYY